jgi:CelD/BcsL family acetyltransferase involved in cellulose biosynthesis
MSVPARIVERQSPVPSPAPGKIHLLPSAAAPAAQPVTLDLVTTRAGFEALEGPWNALFARAGRDTQVFQTYNWLWHWTNHFLPAPGMPGPELSIVTARAGDRLVMVWPLVLDRVGPVKRLSWMGEPVSQYGDVLIDDVPDASALLRAAWDFVIERTGAGVLQLRKVREDSAIAPLLAEMGAAVTTELKAPYLNLASAPSFAEYEKRYSSGARRNRKRQRRRLEERGAVALSWHTEGAEAETLTAEAFRLKMLWLHQRGIVSPALADPRTARFFTDATRAETHPAGCHVLSLSCGGRPVALEIGVRAKGRTAIHVIAYDLDFEKTGAGSLLMEDSIRRACDDGLATFDLLAPGDGYKLEWADDAVTVRDWAAPVSLLGHAYATVYLGFVRTALKRGLDALPVGARRQLAGLVLSLRARLRALTGGSAPQA